MRNRRASTSLGDPGSSAWRRLSSCKRNANGDLRHDDCVLAKGVRRADGQEKFRRYIRAREGGRALGVVVVGLFPCLLYAYLRLTDFCRNP